MGDDAHRAQVPDWNPASGSDPVLSPPTSCLLESNNAHGHAPPADLISNIAVIPAKAAAAPAPENTGCNFSQTSSLPPALANAKNVAVSAPPSAAIVDAPSSEWHAFTRPDASEVEADPATADSNAGVGAGYFSVSVRKDTSLFFLNFILSSRALVRPFFACCTVFYRLAFGFRGVCVFCRRQFRTLVRKKSGRVQRTRRIFFQSLQTRRVG